MEAAISLAESGGASEEVLVDARKQLRHVATASLERARQSGDPVVLISAIDRADELHADEAGLREAREELKRLAHSRLRDAVSSCAMAELEEALGLASAAGASDAALVASAQRRLRELIEPVARAHVDEPCVVDVAAGGDGSEDDDHRAMEKGLFVRTGKPAAAERSQANFIAPTVIGRQDTGDVLVLEAGLRKPGAAHKVVPSAPQRASLRKQGAALDANAQECTVQ